MSNTNGGPAFPSARDMRFNPDFDHEEGMSLRDYFAAKALQGICAHSDTWGLADEDICVQAYKLADNMVKARELSDGKP